ncbi:MAG: hypothetical protein M3Q58_05600 [Bacteroidota bacterium]|nr:hypothetical protein [Bacteroidota bacterium]
MKKTLLIILLLIAFKSGVNAQSTAIVQGTLNEIKVKAAPLGLTFDLVTLKSNAQELQNINPTYLQYLDISFYEEQVDENNVKLTAAVTYKKSAEESTRILLRYFISNNISLVKIETNTYNTEEFFNNHLQN